MHVNHVTITLGFGKSIFPEFYKKGQGVNLKEALQQMVAKKYNYVTEQEKLAILEFIETSLTYFSGIFFFFRIILYTP